jgi:phage terminase large subunit-like protein
VSDPHAFVSDAIAYADRIANRPDLASFHARLAAERFLRDLDEARHGSRWVFRPELADRAMLFAQQMPNIKGPEAGKPLRLMDWQKFVYANLFGFVDRAAGIRRFQRAAVFVPRGNGKTTISAPLALYLTFLVGEGGAEGYAAAVTRDQARILFEVAQNMVRRSPRMREEWGIGVKTHSIYQDATASSFMPISSDAKSLDGKSVQIAVCDEIASHRTSEVYDALLTALAKREQSLLLSISTATGNTSGIGKQIWDYGLRVLQKGQDDDRLFAVIYSIDDNDDPWSEETWIKANPGWGQSVQPDAIRAIMRQARNNPAQESAAKTRHLNIWVGADEALFSLRAWHACANREIQLADYMFRPCHIGLDLASRTDLAALALVLPEQDDHYTVFVKCFTNEAAVMEARNPSYPAWAAEGDLVVTPGDETDFGWIEDEILRLCRDFRVESVAYDPWAATQLAQRLSDQGVPMVEFRSSTQNFSEPTKELDAAMRAHRLEHDGNGVLTWCIGNVVGREDARSNVYPKKARPENKIDAAIAVIMAMARCMTAPGPSVYETRGLIVLG